MCGIAALLTGVALPQLPAWPFHRGKGDSAPTSTVREPLDALLSRRGPDGTISTTHALDISPKAQLRTISSVLALRERPPTDIQQDCVLFNGEVYDLPPRASDVAHVRALVAATPPGEPLHLDVFDRLKGPWSIIVWRPSEKRLYFARDVLGRRSLLLSWSPDSLVVASVAASPHPSFVELPPIGLCFLDLSARKPVFGCHARNSRIVRPLRHTDKDDRAKPHIENSVDCDQDDNLYNSFLPSSWLRSVGATNQIDQSFSRDECVTRFLDFFRKAMHRRLALSQQRMVETPRFAVLFSGGVDSLLIAAVLDEMLPPGEPLHLINVAFGADAAAITACPDRVTARQGIRELRTITRRPRDIALICVDVAPGDADHALSRHVRQLVQPCDALMDASIGTALWMAAHGQGVFDESGETIISHARVLVSGLGADELMGGYKGRHRTTQRRYGARGVAREMDVDLSRLWWRNLGRDDRLIADCGKEVRHPFLDEDLVSFVTSLPVEQVCDLSLPDGVGDKQLLRRTLQRIGFGEEATRRCKRAMQFGSRSKQVLERRTNRRRSPSRA